MARHGENIHKRKDGRWEARYIHHYDENNRAVYRSIYGKSYSEAKEKRNKAIMQIDVYETTSIKKNISITTLSEDWLRTKKMWVKESTYTRYHQIIHKYILPQMGDCTNSSLTQESVERCLRMLQNCSPPLAPKTIDDIRIVLKMLLKHGELRGFSHIEFDKLPRQRRERKPIVILSRQDQHRLLQYLRDKKDCRVYLGVLIALYTGLRIGEVCGLQWEDISSANASLQVSRTVLRINDMDESTPQKTKLVVQKPKSESSTRIIPIPEEIHLILEQERGPDSCYVLTGTELFMEPRSLQKKLQSTFQKLGVEGCSFHSLRHTFATRCIESGMDVKSLSEIMGHSNVTTTMQMYVHPSLESKREQLNMMTRWLGN